MILIIDDHKDTAQAFCRLLRRMGYPCNAVSGGPEGIAYIRAHPAEMPLLVVLDEMMPEMNGIEVLRQLRSDPATAHTPVIIYTAGFDSAKRDEAIALGAAAWLLKGGDHGVDLVLKEITTWYERVGGVRQIADEKASP